MEVLVTESDLVQIGSKRGENLDSFVERQEFMNEDHQVEHLLDSKNY